MNIQLNNTNNIKNKNKNSIQYLFHAQLIQLENACKTQTIQSQTSKIVCCVQRLQFVVTKGYNA